MSDNQILELARAKIANLREMKKDSEEWHGACPFCSSDDDGFMCWPTTGNYWCRTCGETGFSTQFIMKTQHKTWHEARAILGVKSNHSNGKHQAVDSELVYKSRAHYAAVKGLPESVFIAAKFSEIETYQGRPAMKYVTYDSDNNIHYRVRFMDGKKPKYKPVGEGVPFVWYRLNQAMGISNKTQKPVVIVNGEVSVLAAQHYNIPAICRTGGEMALTDELIAELQKMYPKSRPREIIIALDCDKKGRDTALVIEKQLKEAKYEPLIIDLGFSDTGDFNDFTRLHTKESAKQLESLVSVHKPISLNMHAASKDFTFNIINRVAPPGKILINPFKTLHRLGGDAEFMHPKRLSLIFSMSGHFKTAFWEAMVDGWVQNGFSGIVDGQEFTSQDYHMRRVLRQVGHTIKGLDKSEDVTLAAIDYRDVVRYQIYLQEQRDKMPNFMRQGVDTFTGTAGKVKLDSLQYVDKFIQSWRGHVEYVPYIFYLEDRIAFMKDWIIKRRANGGTVEFAVFDYVQLMFARDNDGGIHNYQYCISLMKAFAMEMNVHVIAVSQVNKQPSKDAKKNNKRLMVSDMSYINDNDANLSIALNFYYAAKTDENGAVEIDDNGDAMIERKILPSGHNAALVDVLKNSHGQPMATKMPVDATHLRWVDSTWA